MTYDFDMLLESHSDFDFNFPYRRIHIIRDPRDIIISGCFFHQASTEQCLHVSDPAYDGMTYQQKINSFSDINDQIIFEMENFVALKTKSNSKVAK